MTSLEQFLLARRLLPRQFIRLEADLFLMLQELAAIQGKTIDEFAIEALYSVVNANFAQARNDRRWDTLTPREQQVAALACLGYTNQEIAQELVISVNTVRSHMRSILYKYQAANKAELRLALAGWDFQAWVEAL
jgi:DNA-binding CsgD family transcriptional regulator